jgi:PKD repeat protein
VADSLIWDFGDGTIKTGNSPSHIYSIPGSYLVSVVALNADGCTDTVQFPDTIHVYSNPVVDFSTTVTSGCSPLEVGFNDLSSSLMNPQYYWDFGNGDFSTLQNPVTSFLQSGVYTVSLIITNDGGCSDTLIMYDLLQVWDPSPPSATDLYRVSVESSDYVRIEWQKATAVDLDYYVVYRLNNTTGQYDSIAQVFANNTGVNNNVPFLNDSNVNVMASTYSYKVQGVDFCGNRLPLSALQEHETILLNAVPGHQKVELSWTGYNGCAISGYDIYRRDNPSSPYTKISTVASGSLNFTDTLASCPNPYEYKVAALSICANPLYNSWSNEVVATPSSDIMNQIVDVTLSTVINDEYVLVEWLEPSVLPQFIDRYDIYRSTDKVNFLLHATVPSNVFTYEDSRVSVDATEYYYKILAKNVCNVNTNYGSPGSSILLQKTDLSSGYMLKWTSYFNWDTGVEFYVIEKLNSTGQWEEVERLPGGITEWEEK